MTKYLPFEDEEVDADNACLRIRDGVREVRVYRRFLIFEYRKWVRFKNGVVYQLNRGR